MHGVCIPHRIPHAWEQQGCRKKEETDTIIIINEYGKKERGHYKEEKSQTRPN